MSSSGGSDGRVLFGLMRRAFRALAAMRDMMLANGLLDLPFLLMVALVLPVLMATVAFFFGVKLQGGCSGPGWRCR